MKKAIVPAIVLCFALPVFSQAPAPAPTPAAPPVPVQVAHSNELGFAFSLPSDWEVTDTRPMLPVVQQQIGKTATTDAEKKGVACVQLPLKATHGDPASSIVVVALDYDCFGQRFTDNDLPAFAGGVSSSMQKKWNIVNPVYGAYMLGSHSVWIEHATGNPLDHPETTRTLDVVCSLLKKGAVCWMAFAANDADLATFEHSLVTLDEDPPTALVPARALSRKPS